MNLRKARAGLDRALELVLGTLLLLMVVVVLWQVFTRFVLGSPASGTEELVRFALLWLSLLGASYGFGQRSHLAIDLLPASRIQRYVVSGAIAFFAVVVLIVGGGLLARVTLTLGQTSSALSIERGLVYLVLPLSGFVILFYVFAQARGD